MSHCQGCGAELSPSPYGRPRKWCGDRCRRHTLYSGACVDCGVPTYSGTVPPSERCGPCAALARRIWTEETIIAAIRAWAVENGQPPTATDWNPDQAAALGHPKKAEKFRLGHWPAVSTVQERFDSWAAAIRAAGFTPGKPGQYGRDGEDMELCQRVREAYEAGATTAALADEYGVGREAIRYRIRKAGGTLRPAGSYDRQRVAA